jgi:hypothetical protein
LQVLKGMFAHIRTKYGSLESYLDSIDFTQHMRTDLKETLLHGAKRYVATNYSKEKRIEGNSTEEKRRAEISNEPRGSKS